MATRARAPLWRTSTGACTSPSPSPSHGPSPRPSPSPDPNPNPVAHEHWLVDELAELGVGEVGERGGHGEVGLVRAGHDAEAAVARARGRELHAHREQLRAHLACLGS